MAASESNSKRKQQAAETRNRILNTSIALIKKNGFHQVTVDDICESCGLSKGAFYHHFKSKQDIISESEHQLNEVLETTYADSREEHVREQILVFLNSMLAEVERSGLEFARQRTIYVVGGAYIQEQRHKSFAVTSRALLEQILKNALERGELIPETPVSEILDLLMTFVSGMISEWCLFDGSYSLTEKSWKLTMRLVSSLLAGYQCEDSRTA